MTVLGIAILVAIGAAVLFVRKGIVRPAATLTGAMRRLAEHDMTVAIPGADRSDELGTMAASVVAFRDNMVTRAGDAGKGFAVVASEVKNLAQQTARAMEEIGAQIGQVQAETQEAVRAIRGNAETIAGVSAVATAIAAAVEEQEAATAEIAATSNGPLPARGT